MVCCVLLYAPNSLYVTVVPSWAQASPTALTPTARTPTVCNAASSDSAASSQTVDITVVYNEVSHNAAAHQVGDPTVLQTPANKTTAAQTPSSHNVTNLALSLHIMVTGTPAAVTPLTETTAAHIMPSERDAIQTPSPTSLNDQSTAPQTLAQNTPTTKASEGSIAFVAGSSSETLNATATVLAALSVTPQPRP